MGIHSMAHKGYQVRVSAFQISNVGRYFALLVIVRLDAQGAESFRKIREPQSESDDGMFGTASEAIEASIAAGIKEVNEMTERPPRTPDTLRSF